MARHSSPSRRHALEIRRTPAHRRTAADTGTPRAALAAVPVRRGGTVVTVAGGALSLAGAGAAGWVAASQLPVLLDIVQQAEVAPAARTVTLVSLGSPAAAEAPTQPLGAVDPAAVAATATLPVARSATPQSAPQPAPQVAAPAAAPRPAASAPAAQPATPAPAQESAGEDTSNDSQDSDSRAGTSDDGDSSSSDSTDDDATNSDAKSGDTKDGDTKDGDTKDGDSKDGDSKSGDSDTEDGDTGDAANGASTGGDSGSGNSTGSSASGSDSSSGDNSGSDDSSSNSSGSDNSSSDNSSSDTTSADSDSSDSAARGASDAGSSGSAASAASASSASSGTRLDPRIAPGSTGLPAAAGRTASGDLPSQIIDTKNWYLTLPTGKKGSPDIVEGSALARYHSQFFQVSPAKDGVVFTANTSGATTSGSHYPRSELREMNGSQKASWDGRKGRHTMEIVQAITETPKSKPDVIAGQIHGTTDDLMQIHLSGSRLTVKYADGKKYVDLDPNYKLGTMFAVKIESAGGRVKVWYNGQLKADLPIWTATSYFKAGVYTNSNPSKGDRSGEGQVVIRSLSVQHA